MVDSTEVVSSWLQLHAAMAALRKMKCQQKDTSSATIAAGQAACQPSLLATKMQIGNIRKTKFSLFEHSNLFLFRFPMFLLYST